MQMKETRTIVVRERVFVTWSSMLAGSLMLAWSLLIGPTGVAAGEDRSAEGSGDSGTGEVVFEEDFESGADRWEVLDPKTWRVASREGNRTFEITARRSEYSPPTRSPGHVALIEGLELGSFEITFRVRSTLDTGNHRDCCVFFGYQDSSHFYYAHLGARPDPHSGQIMIVDEAPRKAMTENTKRIPWTDDWHRVRLTRDSDSGLIRVYFDDMETPVMAVTDKTFGEGRIGIGSFDDLNEFDDVVVRGGGSK